MLKRFFRKRRLKKDASTIKTGLLPLKKIHSVTAVIDASEPGWDNCLKTMEAFCKSSGISLSVLFIDIRKQDRGIATGPDRDRTVTRKDINWFGRPDLKKAALVTGGPVDLLLCLTDDASFCTEYLSKAVKARFKIGRKPFDGDPFDIIVAERLAETPDPEGDTMGNRPDTQPRTASTSVIEEIFMTITEIITKIE